MYSNFLYVIDILGTAAFAVSGTFSALERKLDPFGILIVAFATAIGGGTIRDVLVGNLPVNWLDNEAAILTIFLSALFTMLFGSYFKHLAAPLFLFDALGLGLFTIVGVEVGLRQEFSASVCIALGTITACFGGVLRDVLLNKVPLIFRREIYALACIVGGSIYYLLYFSRFDNDLAKVICIALIFIIRFISVRYKLALPRISLKEQS